MPKKPIQIRVDDGELAEWNKRAEATALSLSAWIRERCNAADNDKAVLGARDADLGQVGLGTPELVGKPRARKLEFAEQVAGRTGHDVGCACFQCVQAERFFKSMRKEE